MHGLHGAATACETGGDRPLDSSSGTIAWPDAHHSCCVLVTCGTPLPHRPHIRVCIQDGLAFGQLALRQVSACVLAGRSDTRLLAFWWTNAVHLRGFLQSLSLAMAQATGETGTNDEAPKHWAAEVSTPPACCHNRPPPPPPPTVWFGLACLPACPPSYTKHVLLPFSARCLCQRF